MISILIPTYNYQITALVEEVHMQFTACNVPFEIICLEDGSDKKNIESNFKIEELTHTTLLTSDNNLGRIKSRQHLCEAAKYNWLLFLDADVMPKNKTFAEDYLACINKPFDVFYGGFAYDKNPPSESHILRWKYGIKHEEVAAQIRNQKPYKVIISANFLVKKTVFMTLVDFVDYNIYGLDSYIGAKLKEQQIKVLHIDNEVLHLGIETSKFFLKKKEQASEALLKLIHEENIVNYDNSLLSLYLKLKRYKLNYIFSILYSTFESGMKKNLLSNNPSITLLQFYRISYMCYKDLKPDS